MWTLSFLRCSTLCESVQAAVCWQCYYCIVILIFFSFCYFSVYCHFINLDFFFLRRKWHRENNQLCMTKGEENSIWMPTVCPYFCKQGSWYWERWSSLPQLHSKLCELVHISIFVHYSPFSLVKACCFYKIIPYFIDTKAIYNKMYHQVLQRKKKDCQWTNTVVSFHIKCKRHPDFRDVRIWKKKYLLFHFVISSISSLCAMHCLLHMY